MLRKVRFNKRQQELIEKAKVSEIYYKGDRIVTYRWGTIGSRVLLCHGWRSKIADFRQLIEGYLESGYVVESVDI